MDLQNARRIVLFGGSFDPPHVAHVALPMLVMRTVEADAVAFIPAARAPHKQGKPQTPANHRLAMLRLAVESIPYATILTDEIDRGAGGEPSYTVDTLASLRQRLPNTQMRLLIGADMMRIFHTWREPARIAQLAEPLVMVRPPDTRESLLAELAGDAESAAWRPRMLDLPLMAASSTEIRSRVRRGEPIDGFVPPSVVDYIRREGLYRRKEVSSE